MIDQPTIDRILDAANIVDVVSEFVTLRKRGVNYVGLCPFHDDKTPSFYVSPSKNICKCFACGEGGTAVHFIMKHEQLGYFDALHYLAKKYNLTPVGTMAHEWIMCVGQGNHKHNPAYSNWYALDAWVREYGVLNGIALTDAITTDCFLRDFQLTYATLFSGVRHDSGDPVEWGEKMIAHYQKLGINPAGKTLLFSDSLDFARAHELYEHFRNRTKVAFGIGTYISNDTEVPALNIVMKTTLCNGMDVAKISDTPGKGMCKNPDYVHYLKRCIDWRMNHDR